jgi:hypothetical protein
LDVLQGGLGKSKLQFLIKKDNFFFQLYFFLKLFIIKTLDPNPEPDPDPYLDSLEMLDRIRIEWMDPDPQRWLSDPFIMSNNDIVWVPEEATGRIRKISITKPIQIRIRILP